MNLQRLVKSRRRALGLSQSGLARLLGWDPAQVSRLENGHVANPTAATRKKLAKALRVKLSDPM
jgi:transcriptional regulator with XRE-family HTH domain